MAQNPNEIFECGAHFRHEMIRLTVFNRHVAPGFAVANPFGSVAVQLTKRTLYTLVRYAITENGVGRGVRCRYLCPHTPVHTTSLRIPRLDNPPPAA